MLASPEAELVCSALSRELSLTQRSVQQVHGFAPLGDQEVFLDCYTESILKTQTTYVTISALTGQETWGFKQNGPLYTVTLDCDLVDNNQPTDLILFSGANIPQKTIKSSWYGKPIVDLILASHARSPEVMIRAKDIITPLYPLIHNPDQLFLSYEEIIEASARLAIALREMNPMAPLPYDHTYANFPRLNPHYVTPSISLLR